MRTYGYNACKMADNMTFEELTAMANRLRDDPANANPQHANGNSIYLYTKATHKRLDAIAWAITYKLKELRELRAS